jgi:nucleotide-binding universal stress UspA family protein
VVTAAHSGIRRLKSEECPVTDNMRILVGYDGSNSAEAALHDLRCAGLPASGEVVVLTAAEVSPHLPPSIYEPMDAAALAEAPSFLRNTRTIAQPAFEEARSTAARGAELVSAELPEWKVSYDVATDYSAYRALVQRADRWRPDLVVVGSHGRSAAGRALLGSVSQQVLSHAVCSVRVARFRGDGKAVAGGPVRIVIGIDGSIDSAAAVSAVADRVWPAGSEIFVVMAIDPHVNMALAYGPHFGVLARPSEDGRDSERARQIAQRVADELKRPGLSAVPIVQEGDPKQVLLREAERCNADSIVVGAKGHSRLERFLLGSVSSAVAARARCTVEVVRLG